MFFSRIGRFETQRTRDFRTGRRHATFGNGVLNEPEDLSLTGREVGHASPVYVTSSCYYIQYVGAGKWDEARLTCRIVNSPPNAPAKKSPTSKRQQSYMPSVSSDDKKQRLSRMSYAAFLRAAFGA